jgi:hypothetical protein
MNDWKDWVKISLGIGAVVLGAALEIWKHLEGDRGE